MPSSPKQEIRQLEESLKRANQKLEHQDQQLELQMSDRSMLETQLSMVWL